MCGKDVRSGTDRISVGALRLHAQALLASFEAGHAGFVGDAFVATLDAGSEVGELCRCGIWSRGVGGYRVVSSEALRMADEVLHEVDHAAPPRGRSN